MQTKTSKTIFITNTTSLFSNIIDKIICEVITSAALYAALPSKSSTQYT